MRYKSIFNIIKNVQWRELLFSLWKYVILAVGIPTVIFVFVFFSSSINSSYKDFENIFAASSNKSAQKFKNNMDDFFDESVEISQNTEVFKFLNDYQIRKDYVESIVNYTTIQDILFKLVREYEILDSVWIYSINYNETITAYRDTVSTKEDEDRIIKLCLENREGGGLWRNEIPKPGIGDDYKTDVITVAFPLHHMNYDDVGGLLILNIDCKTLEDFLLLNNEFGDVYLLKSDGNVISVNDKNNAGALSDMMSFDYNEIVNSNNKDEYVVKRGGLDTYCCIGYDDMSFAIVFSSGTTGTKKMLRVVITAGITIAIITIVAMLFLSYIISMMLCKFIVTIVFEFGIDNGNDVKEIYDREYLKQRFLSTIKRDSKIEGELASRIMQLRNTQVLALQTQINPHFVFNTLNLVTLMILDETKRDCAASKVLSLLSDVLDYSLNTEEFTTTIEEELLYVNKYIEIEMLKCDERIEFIKNIDETLIKGRTVKFSLQPILENCIVHGFDEEEARGGKVILEIFMKDNKIHTIIRDNGGGASPEKIEELNSRFKNIEDISDGRHIGLVNVNHRFRIIYGDEAFMRVFNDSEGFVVEIIQPFEL